MKEKFSRQLNTLSKLFLAVLFLIPTCTACQGTPLTPTPASVEPWVRTFEGPGYGAFFDLVLTPDGNVLAVGATNHLHFPPYSGDALFVKLTLEGDVLWEQTWGGDGYEQAWAVARAGEGGYYVFGETDSYGAGDRDFFLLKITEEGTEEWFQTYGREGREWPYGMLALSNGDLLLFGFTETAGGGDRDQYALRLNPAGDIMWEYNRGGPGEEIVLDAIETAGGDLVLAVSIGEDGGLVNLAADGQVQWEQRYELDGWQYASQVVQTEEGGFLLAGFLARPGGMADTWLAGCSPSGELEWETAIDNPAFDYAIALIPLKDKNYLVGGLGDGMPLYRIDKDGSLLWERSLGGAAVYGARALIELESGGYLVAGFIQILNGYSYDAILLRTDSEGRVGE